MLVSHIYKFIYTKTVKTASTSVELYFEKYCISEYLSSNLLERDEIISESGIIGFRGAKEDRIKNEFTYYNHMPAYMIKRYVGEEIWNNYFKFCVVRNPFDKMVSAFIYFNTNEKPAWTDTDQIVYLFRNWIKSKKRINFDRDKYMIDGKVCMDYFIRFENLITELEIVCEKVRIPFESERLLITRSSKKFSNLSISDFYDTDCIKIIQDSYAFEFDYFKYSAFPTQ